MITVQLLLCSESAQSHIEEAASRVFASVGSPVKGQLRELGYLMLGGLGVADVAVTLLRQGKNRQALILYQKKNVCISSSFFSRCLEHRRS